MKIFFFLIDFKEVLLGDNIELVYTFERGAVSKRDDKITTFTIVGEAPVAHINKTKYANVENKEPEYLTWLSKTS